jgi:hypothetical protein
MKKLILSVTAVAGFSMGAFAQGVIAFDATENNTSPSPTATSNGQTFLQGVLDTSTDINAELLYSTTGLPGTFSPVVTLLLSSTVTAPTSTGVPPLVPVGQTITGVGDIANYAGLYDNSGAAYYIPTGSTLYFEVEGWTGVGATYANAALSGVTSPFQVTLSATTSPIIANLSAMPALNLTTAVPEPSTLAMAGVGLASMLIFRRKNK